MNDPARIPVLVGASQWEDRSPDPADPTSPLDALEAVSRGAAVDAGFSNLDVIDTIAVIPAAGWTATNPPGALASRLGIAPGELVDTGNGGEVGVRAINWLAQRIVDGESSVALLAHSHLMRTLELAGRQGIEISWTDDVPGEPRALTPKRHGTTEFEGMSGIRADESAIGLSGPPQLYPLFENALAAHHGRSHEEHMQLVGRLFSRFTEVAAANPHAWFPTYRSPEELITPTPTNRMISFPYTKYLNAILNTDQAAGLILMSAQQATDLGIPEDRWVHWWGGNHAAEEAWWVSTRPDFAMTPSMLDSHAGALANAGVSIDDIGIIDFYSCFPAPVEMACKVLGLALDDPRNFTITGGLPYGGGPGSGYTLHSLATMVDRVREEPETKALITGNGFYLTKHSASIWSGRPFDGERLASTHPDQFATGVERAPVEPQIRSGRGTVETFTVVHARDGEPERAIAIGRFDDGSRFMAAGPNDPEAMRAIESQGLVGRAVDVSVDEGGCRFEVV